MVVIQEQGIINNNYKKYILNNPKITNDIYRKYREKSETLH
jgi:hypothetical protein